MFLIYAILMLQIRKYLPGIHLQTSSLSFRCVFCECLWVLIGWNMKCLIYLTYTYFSGLLTEKDIFQRSQMPLKKPKMKYLSPIGGELLILHINLQSLNAFSFQLKTFSHGMHIHWIKTKSTNFIRKKTHTEHTNYIMF